MIISIITVVLNREDTIAHAISSVNLQTYKNFDHLILDGVSADGTLAAIKRVQHSRMKVISEPDKGIYDALNKGIARSTGDVIGLIHSDDFFADEKVLERVAAAFSDPDIDAVYGDLEYVSAADPAHTVRRWQAGSFTPRKLGWGWMPPHPTLFLRRRVFEAHGVYDASYHIAADYDAILRWFGQGGIRAAYIPEVLVKMRLGGKSNRSLGSIFRKSLEDYRALRSNKVGGIGALAVKNLSKIPQFFPK